MVVNQTKLRIVTNGVIWPSTLVDSCAPLTSVLLGNDNKHVTELNSQEKSTFDICL